jgi:hypothetical protein
MKVNLIIVLVIVLSSCNIDGDTTPDVSYDLIHNCLPIPDDVPATFKSGTPIGWDCEMKAFYVNGDLVLHYDSTGGLIAIEKVR